MNYAFLWLGAFCGARALGALWGIDATRLFDYRQLVMIVAGALCGLMISKKLWTMLWWLIILAAGFWSLAHSTQPAEKLSDRRVSIIKSENFSFQSRLVMVRNKIGETATVYSKHSVGSTGTVTCKLLNRQKICFLQPTLRTPKDQNLLSSLVLRLRSGIERSLQSLPYFVRGWLALIILGEESILDQDAKDAFKRAGLFHLLVISGFHIGVLAGFAKMLSQALLIPFYAAKLMTPVTMLSLQVLAELISAFGALVFALLVGMSAASQRAALCFLCIQMMRALRPHLPISGVFVLVGTIQSAVFPLGFFSAGNLMSWVSTMILAYARSSSSVWRCLLAQQVALSALTVLLFEQWTPLGFFLNPLLGEYFNLLMLLGIASFFLSTWCKAPMIYFGGLMESFVQAIVQITSMFGLDHLLEQGFPASSLIAKLACLILMLLVLKWFSSGIRGATIDETSDIRMVTVWKQNGKDLRSWLLMTRQKLLRR